MIAEFHEAAGLEYGHAQDGSGNELRAKLHTEENLELLDELLTNNRVGIAQELADVVYIAYGSAYSLGIPLDAVLAEVHAANMRKFGPDGACEKNESGKVLKPAGWEPPDIQAVLEGEHCA